MNKPFIMIFLLFAGAALGIAGAFWFLADSTVFSSRPLLATQAEETVETIDNPLSPLLRRRMFSGSSGPTPVFDPVIPCAAGLDAFFEPFDNSVAIFYKNIRTGFTYMYNPDLVFFGASVPKMHHALYMYALAERGYISLDTVHTYSYSDFWGGTGVIQHGPFGETFTTRELLGHSIRDSDNAAHRMLLRHYNNLPFSYIDFAREIGADYSRVSTVPEYYITAREAGIWALALYYYLESDSRYAHLLSYDLQNAAVNFIHSDYPMAQKYGWYRRWFHESAIVYADSPYILVILSSLGQEGGLHVTNTWTHTHGVFEEISRFMQDFHHRYFGRMKCPVDISCRALPQS